METKTIFEYRDDSGSTLRVDEYANGFEFSCSAGGLAVLDHDAAERLADVLGHRDTKPASPTPPASDRSADIDAILDDRLDLERRLREQTIAAKAAIEDCEAAVERERAAEARALAHIQAANALVDRAAMAKGEAEREATEQRARADAAEARAREAEQAADFAEKRTEAHRLEIGRLSDTIQRLRAEVSAARQAGYEEGFAAGRVEGLRDAADLAGLASEGAEGNGRNDAASALANLASNLDSWARESPAPTPKGPEPAVVVWERGKGMDGGDVWMAEHQGWRLVAQGGIMDDAAPSWEWEVERDEPRREVVRGAVSVDADPEDDGWEAAANGAIAEAKARAESVVGALAAGESTEAATKGGTPDDDAWPCQTDGCPMPAVVVDEEGYGWCGGHNPGGDVVPVAPDSEPPAAPLPEPAKAKRSPQQRRRRRLATLRRRLAYLEGVGILNSYDRAEVSALRWALRTLDAPAAAAPRRVTATVREIPPIVGAVEEADEDAARALRAAAPLEPEAGPPPGERLPKGLCYIPSGDGKTCSVAIIATLGRDYDEARSEAIRWLASHAAAAAPQLDPDPAVSAYLRLDRRMVEADEQHREAMRQAHYALDDVGAGFDHTATLPERIATLRAATPQGAGPGDDAIGETAGERRAFELGLAEGLRRAPEFKSSLAAPSAPQEGPAGLPDGWSPDPHGGIRDAHGQRVQRGLSAFEPGLELLMVTSCHGVAQKDGNTYVSIEAAPVRHVLGLPAASPPHGERPEPLAPSPPVIDTDPTQVPPPAYVPKVGDPVETLGPECFRGEDYPMIEPATLNTPQPKPRPAPGPAAWDLVLADIAERDRMGTAKYGQRLTPGDGRDSLVDAYQEALDMVVYLRKAIAERPPVRPTSDEPGEAE